MIQFYGNLRSVISEFRNHGMKLQLALKIVCDQRRSRGGILSTAIEFVHVTDSRYE